jgi:carboxylesterase type B
LLIFDTDYKCHSGDLISVFGTIISQGRPLRDQDDIPFSQYIIDSWTSFARTGNPNPDRAFLKARGFTNTTLTLEAQGLWKPVTVKELQLKALDVHKKGGMRPFREEKQCDVLGFGLGYYNK